MANYSSIENKGLNSYISAAHPNIVDSEELSNIIQDIAFDETCLGQTGLSRILTDHSHVSRHQNKSFEELVDRLFESKRMHSYEDIITAASSFHPDTDIHFLIRESLLDYSDNIANWLLYENTPALSVPLKDPDGNNIGYGFDGALQAYETADGQLILQRDNRTTDGFYIKTAYPSLNTENKKALDINGFAILKKNKKFQQLNEIEKKTAIALCSDTKGFVKAKGLELKDGYTYICYDNNKKLQYKIKEQHNGIFLQTRTVNPTTVVKNPYQKPNTKSLPLYPNDMKLQAFEHDFPEFCSTIKRAETRIAEYTGHSNQITDFYKQHRYKNIIDKAESITQNNNNNFEQKIP